MKSNNNGQTAKGLQIVVSNEMHKETAKHLAPYLQHEDRQTLTNVVNTKDLEKGRTNYGGEDEIFVLFTNTFKLKRSESKTVKGEYIKHSRNKYEDHKNDENYFNTGKKDKEGNEIWELKHTTVTGWRQHKIDKIVHELPTTVFYPYPLAIKDATKLNLIMGAALTELKEDQHRREKEGRPTLRKTGAMHLQIFVNGKKVLNTQEQIFEGLPARLLFSDFKRFAVQMFERAKLAADKKTGTVQEMDVNAIFPEAKK